MTAKRILRNCRLARRSYNQLTARPPVSAPLPDRNLQQEKERAFQQISGACRVAEAEGDEKLLEKLVPLVSALISRSCRTLPEVRGILQDFDFIMKRTPNVGWALRQLDDLYNSPNTTVYAMKGLSDLEHQITRSDNNGQLRELVTKGRHVAESQRLTCKLHFCTLGL